jgi:hypothetical protein
MLIVTNMPFKLYLYAESHYAKCRYAECRGAGLDKHTSLLWNPYIKNPQCFIVQALVARLSGR